MRAAAILGAVGLALAATLAAACGRRASVAVSDAAPIVADAQPAAAGPPSPPSELRADLRGGRHELEPHGEGPSPEGHEVVPCPVPPDAELDGVLDEAAKRYDSGAFAIALACAERAVRMSPSSVAAHHDRGLALAGLERWDDARMAFARALAIDPIDPETLAGAADLYVNLVPPSREATELGLEYARRGALTLAARPRPPAPLAARLAWIEAQALDDLGRSDEALARVDAARALAPGDAAIAALRAVILFHLCRFADADAAFAALPPAAGGDDAFELWHRGLIAERLGRQAEADRLLARAHTLAPSDFPDPALVPSAREFRAMVDRAVAALPPVLKAALDGVPVEVADLPALEDLVAVQPPFAPTILGLFRGASLGEPPLPGDPPRAIVLYRKNLARAVMTRADLEREVQVTLWHEIGHLRGADEDDLRDRGLE